MIEIERKFLVLNDSYKKEASRASVVIQGYLCTDVNSTVRVRMIDDKAFITIKGKNDAAGVMRYEWEKEITADDARELLKLCGGRVIEKTRYYVPVVGSSLVFEVDEFHGKNEGLTVAEIELPSPDCAFSRPSWLGTEVTGDERYYNSNLV
ncbi:MAG: CYTH domain-containing protein [Candidatus Limimorpha sp.]